VKKVSKLTPREDLEAERRLSKFIRAAKEDLIAFGGLDAWDRDRWVEGRTVVIFATKTEHYTSHEFSPMHDPFRQFAKAYVRHEYSLKPVVSLATMMQAMRCIECSLIEATGSAEIKSLNCAVADLAAEKCREFYLSEELWCNVGRHLEKIFQFIRDEGFCPGLGHWRSPFKRAKSLLEDLGEAGKGYRESKLPSCEEMLMVADTFAQADDAESLYFSSIIILLMATPSRVSEVLSLPVDCIQWEMDDQGTPQMYLRWRASKGKGPMKKWIIPAMHDVVKEAVRRLLAVGSAAREAAEFAFQNPGQFLIHEGCLDGRTVDQMAPLMPDAFCAAIDVKCPGGGRLLDGSHSWARICVDKKLARLIETGRTSYHHLAEYILSLYAGPHWPYIDDRRSVHAWSALCLHRQNEFHKEFAVKHFSWRLADVNEVNSRLSSDKNLSLFDRRGFKKEDGASIKLTTHQLRHWISTMSERAGMDDYTLAQWAGRARIEHNRHYDNRSPEELFRNVKEVVPSAATTLLERLRDRKPVFYKELGVDRVGTAKATLYGMCVHDYAMAPCQKQRECMTCSEHVCIKGDHITLERIRTLEKQTDDLLRAAQRAHQDGDFGADRWVDNHKWKLAHVRSMRIALEQVEVEEGEILRIPVGHDPSPVRRTLIEIGLIEPQSLQVSIQSRASEREE